MISDLEIERLKRSDKMTPEELLKLALHDVQNNSAHDNGGPVVKIFVLAVVETAEGRHSLVTYEAGFNGPAESVGYLSAFQDKEMRRWYDK